MKKTIIYIILFVIFLAACNRRSVPGVIETAVHINVSLTEAETVTRAPIIGPSFPNYYYMDNRGSYGIFVCKNGTTNIAHKSNSWNIRALYTTAAGWNYYYVQNLVNGIVATTGYDHITLTAKDDDATADLYAYAPYNQNAYYSGPTAIQYYMSNEIERQDDLMYAAQNKSDYDGPGTRNIGLDPSSPYPLSAAFTFKHAFALLAFEFKLKNDASSGAYGTGTNYLLSNITVTLNDPDSDGATTAKLYRSGTFNALTGTFNNDGKEVPSLSVAQYGNGLNINSASSPTTAYLMLVPTDVADDELVFTFTVSGQTLQPFKLKRSYVQHGSSGVYGFQAGYKYTFKFTLDNYIYFDGFSVGEWITPVDPLGEQEI